MEDVWYSGACLSEHSGVGHIVPHLDEIFTDGLQAMIDKFRALGASKTGKVQHLFYGSYISLCGLQKYFLNYADLCDRRIEACSQYEEYSKECLGNLACNLRHISKHAPKTLVQGAQLALSVFISLHITG